LQRNLTHALTYALSIAAFVLLLTCNPRSVRGSAPLRWFGNDARSAAMGGSGVALGKSGLGDLLLNPAQMSFGEGGLWLGFSAAFNWLHIDPLPKDPAFDVPESIYESSPNEWTADRPVPTSMLTEQRGTTGDLPTTFLLSAGAVGPFLHEDLMIGIGLSLPVPSLLNYSAWYNDEREQYFSNRLHFERFGEFDGVFAIYPGASFAPVDWFSFGVTLQLDLVLGLDSRLYLPEGTEWEYAYMDSAAEVVPILRPIAGLAFRTPIGLGFGLVYRHESYADVGVDVDLRIWNGERPIPNSDEVQTNFKQRHRFILGYKPIEIGAAASYEYGPFSVELGGTLELWSRYLDRHGNDWSHPTWDPEDDIEQPGWDDDWQDPSFDNVVSVRGGAELWVAKWAALRVGLGYFPSPMPRQTGRFNYVDNDLFLYSLGGGFRFEVLGKIVTADLAAQIWHMKSLTVTKSNFVKELGGVLDEVPDDVTDYDGEPLEGADGFQINNPGFPGYKLGGAVFNLALMLGVEFD
jgi:hypothetical protein